MSKKYLVLRSKVPKAQAGWGSNLIVPNYMKDTNNTALKKAVGSNYGLSNNTYQTGLERAAGSDYGANTDFSSTTRGLDSALGMNTSDKGIGATGESGTPWGQIADTAASAGIAASTHFFDKADRKNSRTSGFGTEVYDKGDARREVGKSTINSGLKWGAKGAAIGTMIVPGLGTAIGGAAGFLGGVIGGFIGGRKRAEEGLEGYDTLAGQQLTGKAKSDDERNSQALFKSVLVEKGTKLECSGGKMACGGKQLGRFAIPRTKSKVLIRRTGGKLEEPGAVNVVVKGKLHKENNNLGNKDKGIPVVDSSGNKEYEVEEGEVIFRQDITNTIEKYANDYKETGNDQLLPELGEIVAKELLDNTQDNYGKFGAKVKEDAN